MIAGAGTFPPCSTIKIIKILAASNDRRLLLGTIADKIEADAGIVATTGQFSTLAEALQRTGLNLTLDVPGSVFTVFAPTNEAFADADGNDLAPVLVTSDGTEVNVAATDIQTTNGVIHLVGTVLLPKLD